MTAFIYCLIDPTTNEVRYVGKTNCPSLRLVQHIREKVDSYKGRWVSVLASKGMVPLLEVLEEVPRVEWPEAECWWISYMRALGARLTNTFEGGAGACSIPQEIRAKMSATRTGRRLSEKHLASLSAAAKVRRISDEGRRRLSEAHKGKSNGPCSEETKRKMSETHKRNHPPKEKIKPPPKKRKPCSDEARANMSAAHKGKSRGPRSAETKAKVSASHMGIRPTAETLVKLSESHKGILRSEEAKRKTSESLRAIWAKRKAAMADNGGCGHPWRKATD